MLRSLMACCSAAGSTDPLQLRRRCCVCPLMGAGTGLWVDAKQYQHTHTSQATSIAIDACCCWLCTHAAVQREVGLRCRCCSALLCACRSSSAASQPDSPHTHMEHMPVASSHALLSAHFAPSSLAAAAGALLRSRFRLPLCQSPRAQLLGDARAACRWPRIGVGLVHCICHADWHEVRT